MKKKIAFPRLIIQNDIRESWETFKDEFNSCLHDLKIANLRKLSADNGVFGRANL